MPGSEKQNSMFKKTVRGYRQENHPFAVTSCGRRRNDGSPIFKRKKSNEPRKTTKGKGRNFRTVKEGAGMTSKGVKEYRRKNPGSKLKAQYWACKTLWAGKGGSTKSSPKGVKGKY